MNQLAPITASRARALVEASGPRASYRFLEFFTSNIRNPHARRARSAPTAKLRLAVLRRRARGGRLRRRSGTTRFGRRALRCI
jgi:hypothetical protein